MSRLPRPAVVAGAALILLVTGALLVPRGGGDRDGRIAPSTEQAAPAAECRTFEGQQYCLGLGWTDHPEDRSGARTVAGAESTGDLATSSEVTEPTEAEAAAEWRAAAASADKVAELRAAAPKGLQDYPKRDTVLRPQRVREQRTTYWCGPTTMQMIAWGWQGERKTQRHWARKLGTTSNGTSITRIVRQVNRSTGYDRERRAGKYIVLDVSDWSYRKWLLLQYRHIHDYRAPVVLHPILLKRFYPYLDDDASGHFQVGRGYDKRGDRPAHLGYFEPWNQQRFDRSEPRIARVQWRNAYQSYRANRAHPQQNIGV